MKGMDIKVERKISFIGAGNMGGVLVRGVCGVLDPRFVTLYAPSKRNTAVLAGETGCLTAETLEEAVSASDIIVLAMKPQTLPEVLRQMLPSLKTGKILVSVAAGLKIAVIEGILREGGLELPVIRIMPNTPAKIAKGVILMTESAGVQREDADAIAGLFEPCGLVERISEKYLDMGSPVTSCSPAFVYMFIEALADGGVKIGLPRDKAQRWAAHAVLGAAAMALESGRHPGALKDAVCSPGGTTIEGVGVLEERGFRSAVIAAVEAAYRRNEELSK